MKACSQRGASSTGCSAVRRILRLHEPLQPSASSNLSSTSGQHAVRPRDSLTMEGGPPPNPASLVLGGAPGGGHAGSRSGVGRDTGGRNLGMLSRIHLLF